MVRCRRAASTSPRARRGQLAEDAVVRAEDAGQLAGDDEPPGVRRQQAAGVLQHLAVTECHREHGAPDAGRRAGVVAAGQGGGEQLLGAVGIAQLEVRQTPGVGEALHAQDLEAVVHGLGQVVEPALLEADVRALSTSSMVKISASGVGFAAASSRRCHASSYRPSLIEQAAGQDLPRQGRVAQVRGAPLEVGHHVARVVQVALLGGIGQRLQVCDDAESGVVARQAASH